VAKKHDMPYEGGIELRIKVTNSEKWKYVCSSYVHDEFAPRGTFYEKDLQKAMLRKMIIYIP
jgi:hypothetical protein